MGHPEKHEEGGKEEGGSSRDTPPEVKTLFKYLMAFLMNMIVTFGVVSFWRGAWNLPSVYVYPNDLWKNSWIFLIIGVFGLLLMYLTQPLCRRLYEHIGNNENRESPDDISVPRRFIRAVIDRTFTVACIVCEVWIWKGFWLMWDLNVLVDDQVASNWLSIATGLPILILLYSTASAVAPPAIHFNDKPKFAFENNLFSFSFMALLLPNTPTKEGGDHQFQATGLQICLSACQDHPQYGSLESLAKTSSPKSGDDGGERLNSVQTSL